MSRRRIGSENPKGVVCEQERSLRAGKLALALIVCIPGNADARQVAFFSFLPPVGVAVESRPMIFRQSAVTTLNRWQVTESSDVLPRDIHPALIGSGLLAASFDATGLMGANWSMWQYRDIHCFEAGDIAVEKNLYFYRDSVLSQHYFHNPEGRNSRSFANMPCGWLDYELEIAGEKYDTKRMLKEGRDWERTFEPRIGELKTQFTLNGTRISWVALFPVGGGHLVLQFAAQSESGVEQDVKLQLRCHWTLRHGEPIFRGGISGVVSENGFIFCEWEGTNETCTAHLKKPVNLSYAFLASSGVGKVGSEDIQFDWSGKTGSTETFAFVCGSSVDGTHALKYAQGLKAAVQAKDDLTIPAKATWTAFFCSAAKVTVGSPEKEYLCDLNQYLLKAGLPWATGLPLGTLWTRKFNSATFWDSFFACDGMLRSGHIKETRVFCEYLVRSARPKGRPHMWITYFDGDTPCDDAGDVAYFNCLAFAGCGIRLYEMSQDQEDLEKRVFPYLNFICTHLLENVFEPVPRGGWQLGGIIAGDVDAFQTEAKTQMDILIWSVITLSKFAEYSAKLGRSSTLTQKATEICVWFEKNRIVMDKRANWYQWLPYLAPAHRYADFSKWWNGTEETFKKIAIIPHDQDLSQRIYGDQPDTPKDQLFGTYTGMAWGNFSTAAAATISGNNDLALEFQDGGLKYTSGLGYFTESPYDLQAGGNSPYVPSAGSFLSSLLVMCAEADLWNQELRVGVDMPRFWKYNRISFENVHTFNGAVVNLNYSPHQLSATIKLSRAGRVRLIVPSRIAGEPLHVVSAEGQTIPFTDQTESILLQLDQGSHTVTVARDLNAVRDFTIIEPFDMGQRICALANVSGSTRWLRDFDGLEDVAKNTKKGFIIDVSFVRIFPDIVNILKEQVRDHGKLLVVMYHGGVSSVSPEFAELTGVNGSIARDWVFEGKKVNVTSTEAGQKLGFANQMSMHANGVDIVPALSSDTEVLATIESGVPFLTRRKLGKGSVWWIATGNKIMDRPWGLGWGLHLTRSLFVYGKTRESLTKQPWLDDPDFQNLIQKILKLS